MDEAGIEALLQRGFCGRLATVGDGAPYDAALCLDGRLHARHRGEGASARQHRARGARVLCHRRAGRGLRLRPLRMRSDGVLRQRRGLRTRDGGRRRRDQAALLRRDGQVLQPARGPKDFLPAHRPDRALPARDRPRQRQADRLARHSRPMAGARPQQDAERAAASIDVSGPSSWACASRRRPSALRPCPRCRVIATKAG